MSNFRIKKYLPEKFEETEEIAGLFDVIQGEFVEDFCKKLDKFPEFKNPRKFPIEFRQAFEDMWDFRVPQIRGQTEEEVREQFARIPEWVRLKGLDIAVRSYLASVGFSSRTEVMMSDDYQNFVPHTELFPKPDDFQWTPHVLIEFSQERLIDGKFLTPEDFEILKFRLEQVYPVTTVPHYRFVINAFADEDHNLIERNHVQGITTTKFQSKDVEEVGECHLVEPDGDEIEVLYDFEFMDVERFDHWKLGEFNGTMDENVESLDSVLVQSDEFEIIRRPSQDLAEVDVPIDFPNLIGETYNALAFYNVVDQMMALFRFPDGNELQIFDPQNLDIQFNLKFLKNGPNISQYFVDELTSGISDEESDGEVYLTSNYDLGFNDTIALDGIYRLDDGLSLDEEGKVPNISQVTQWRAGNLDGFSGTSPALKSGPELWNPLIELCPINELHGQNGLDEIFIQIDLVRSPLFHEDIEQIGLYNDAGELLVVFEQDPVTPVDQFSREKMRVNWTVFQG